MAHAQQKRGLSLTQIGEGRLAGKLALVTGGASGLGKTTAELFAEHGARVAVSDINSAGAEAVAEEIGRGAIALTHDVTEEAQWQSVVSEIEQAFGGLNILVNNAGIGALASVEESSLKEWRHVHAVDLDSVFLGCKTALPLMARTDGTGAIVNVSSIAGIIAGHNMAAYNSAKAAVRHLSKSVALHCARQGYPIRCNSVHPTFMDTPIIDGMAFGGDREALIEKLARQVPLGRIGRPEDVAYAVLYLASDEAGFITGAELKIDGGISAW